MDFCSGVSSSWRFIDLDNINIINLKIHCSPSFDPLAFWREREISGKDMAPI